MPERPQILYEDNHLLAVNKPPELATMGAEAGAPSLALWAKQYLKQRYQKPGNVYLGVVSRIDAVASGVVLFARTSKAAARLSEQFRAREVHKIYWALIDGRLTPPSGVCENFVAKDESQQRMVVVRSDFPGAQLARLNYRTVAALAGGTHLEIDLETGRKHQIRLQLAERGFPIRGDSKYGSRHKFAAGIALHSRRLVVAHPVSKQPLTLEAPPPASWPRLELP